MCVTVDSVTTAVFLAVTYLLIQEEEKKKTGNSGSWNGIAIIYAMHMTHKFEKIILKL